MPRVDASRIFLSATYGQFRYYPGISQWENIEMLPIYNTPDVDHFYKIDNSYQNEACCLGLFLMTTVRHEQSLCLVNVFG